MDNQNQATELELSDLDAADTSTMTVTAGGKLTTWKWIFAGPGHPKTVEQSNKAARERLHIERQQDQARVNGKKWKAPEESLDDVRTRNINHIIERLIDWTPVKFGGQPYPFSAENARVLLADRRKVELLSQALEFLAAENSFTKSSETS